MTKQEQQRMTRLEIENNEMREKISRHMAVYGDMLIEIIELKATISLIESAINREFK